MQRRLSYWRLVALVAMAATLAVMLTDPAMLRGTGYEFRGDYIARLTLSGEIAEDPNFTQTLADIADDRHIKALILHIDSPGGTTTGSEAIFEGLREVAAVKPVVATLGTMAASGGYIAALGADYIVARQTSITGSIGVIYSVTDLHKLLDTIGVKIEAIKSAPLKGEPSGLTAMDEKARKAVQVIVDDTYRWFLDLVVERRGLTLERARELGDGRVFTGRQAVDLKLVDRLGGEAEALEWLDEARGVDADLPVLDVAAEVPRPWYEVALGRSLARGVREVVESKSGFLDGLKAVWHPSVGNGR
jgi:protease-4